MVTKHRKPTLGLSFGCFVLQDIPVLGETTGLNSDDVGRYQCCGLPISRKAPMQYYVVALGHDDPVLVAQSVGECPHEIEQAVSARLNMGAMLDVVP